MSYNDALKSFLSDLTCSKGKVTSWFTSPDHILTIKFSFKPKTLSLEIVTIDPEFRHRGIFKSLIPTIESLCKERKFTFTVEDVIKEWFENFFRKRGYEEYSPQCYKLS